MSKSICIGSHVTELHRITIAEWDSDVTGRSYEVGIREHSNPSNFDLVAMYLRSRRAAEEIGKVAAQLSRDGCDILQIKTACEDGNWLDRMLTERA